MRATAERASQRPRMSAAGSAPYGTPEPSLHTETHCSSLCHMHLTGDHAPQHDVQLVLLFLRADAALAVDRPPAPACMASLTKPFRLDRKMTSSCRSSAKKIPAMPSGITLRDAPGCLKCASINLYSVTRSDRWINHVQHALTAAAEDAQRCEN